MKPLSLEEIEKAGEIDISHGVSFNDLHTLQRVFYTAREYHRLKSALQKIMNNSVPGGHDQNIAREALKEGAE